jgi:exonuclease III
MAKQYFGIVLIIAHLLTKLSSSQDQYFTELVISSCNMHGIGTATTYARALLDNCDILAISEHWLPEQELYKLNDLHLEFNSIAKAGTIPEIGITTTHSWGGVALLWRKQIDMYISTLQIYSRRICAVQVHQDNMSPLYIIGVYLPKAGCIN